jgi:hypothetical protein
VATTVFSPKTTLTGLGELPALRRSKSHAAARATCLPMTEFELSIGIVLLLAAASNR